MPEQMPDFYLEDFLTLSLHAMKKAFSHSQTRLSRCSLLNIPGVKEKKETQKEKLAPVKKARLHWMMMSKYGGATLDPMAIFFVPKKGERNYLK